MSTAETSQYTGTGKCGHALCHDDDGHSDGCKFAEVEHPKMALLPAFMYMRSMILNREIVTPRRRALIDQAMHDLQAEQRALDRIAELFRQPEWKVDGSGASFIDAIADELRAVRSIDGDEFDRRPRD